MRSPIRRIGVSKLATVSECLTPQGTHVALKLYDRQSLSPFQHDKIFAAAKRWQALASPSLMTYLDVLPDEKQVAMELMDRSASVRLSEGYSDPRLVSYVLRGVLTGLAYIHEQGLLHVNIKPSNVFFDEAGRAKLSDGLLVPASAPGTLPPPTNQKYLTPEHTSDSFGRMSFATDLYAAGFLALELLAGDRFGRAFQGIGEDTPDDDLSWFQWHGSSQETPLATQFCKTCPPQLEAVIARLTKKNPAERYPSAMAAIADLPPDTPQPTQTANKTPVAAHAEVKRAAFASDVIERPATGVVLAIASGPRAGEMFGTNDTEFFLGFHPDCMLRFSHDQYSNSGAKVLCRRGPEGWIVSRVIGENTFVNQRLLEDKLVLRSGDVIRLSARGPDVQFTMQSGGLAIKSLVSRFLPAQSNSEASRQPASPLAAGVAPRSPGSAPISAAPRRPGSPAEVRPAAPAAPRREAVAPQAVATAPVAAAPKPPTKVQVAAPASKLADRPSAKPTGKPTGKTSDSADSPTGSWLSPKSWNKNQKNTAIAVIGTIVVIIVVILIPSSPSKSLDKPEDKDGQATTAPNDPKTETGSEPESKTESESKSESESNAATPTNSTSPVEERDPAPNP